MDLEKYQKFLKNKHKFDPKPLISDEMDKFRDHSENLLSAIQKEDSFQLKTIMKPFIIDLIKYMNRYDITFEELIKDEFSH